MNKSIGRPKKNLFKLAITALTGRTFLVRMIVIAAITITWILTFFIFYFFQESSNQRQLDALLEQDFADTKQIYQQNGIEGLIEEFSQQRIAFTLFTPYTILVDENNKKIAGNLKSWPDIVPGEKRQDFFYEMPSNLDDIKIRGFFGYATVLDNGHKLLIAQADSGIATLREYSFGLRRLVVFTLLPVAIIGSIILAMFYEDQFDRYNRSIRRIMAGNLNERLPVGRSAIEGYDLAENINAMLDRITLLMEDVRRISDNIAHDLNTPLARLHNRIESLMHSASEEEKLKLETILDESNHLLSMFKALLRVAKVESGQEKSEKVNIDISNVVRDVVDFYEPLAQDKGIEINCESITDCFIECDPDLIFQMMINIVDNALKYSDSGAKISVRLQRGIIRGKSQQLEPRDLKQILEDQPLDLHKEIEQYNYVSIVIADSGPGIPKESYSKIFQRFYREEKSRSQIPGSGLGLSMVMAVMQIHSGGIYLGSNNPGLIVSLVLPTGQWLSEA